MLVLSRKLHERIILPTIPVAIGVVALKASVARLGIEAPVDVPVFREELLRRDRMPAGDLLAPSQADAQSRLGRMKQSLRYRLHILALKCALIRKRAGHIQDSELQRLCEDLESEMRRDEQQLTSLSAPVEDFPLALCRNQVRCTD